MLCFVVVMQSFIMNSHEVFIHIHQGCFAGTGAIVRLPQCQWSKPDGYGIISQCITTTKHSKAKTVCIYLGIYCNSVVPDRCVTISPKQPHITHCRFSSLPLIMKLLSGECHRTMFDGKLTLVHIDSKQLHERMVTQFYTRMWSH